VFSGSSLTLSYTNFIVLRIYAEALDRLRVRFNMYLVVQQSTIDRSNGVWAVVSVTIDSIVASVDDALQVGLLQGVWW